MGMVVVLVVLMGMVVYHGLMDMFVVMALEGHRVNP
jgi:hypothetical protein